MKTSIRVVLVGFAALSALTLQACGGGGASTTVSTATTGQELTDLKAAFDAGAINEREYERQREAILDR